MINYSNPKSKIVVVTNQDALSAIFSRVYF